MELFERFGLEYELLKDLFPRTNFCRERLNQIFVCTEALWDKNLDRLRGKEVKYLLIAEAPPWATENDAIKYFYNTAPSHWRNLVRNTFCIPRLPSEEVVLQRLADKQFLLIDTLPFSVKYTSTRRCNRRYKKLIRECSSFFCDKLKHPSITWSPEVKVAFALKLNYRAVMRAYLDNRCLKSKIADFDENNIAADDSGNPNPTKMRRIFDL